MIHGFRDPLGVLEHVPLQGGATVENIENKF